MLDLTRNDCSSFVRPRDRRAGSLDFGLLTGRAQGQEPAQPAFAPLAGFPAGHAQRGEVVFFLGCVDTQRIDLGIERRADPQRSLALLQLVGQCAPLRPRRHQQMRKFGGTRPNGHHCPPGRGGEYHKQIDLRSLVIEPLIAAAVPFELGVEIQPARAVAKSLDMRIERGNVPRLDHACDVCVKDDRATVFRCAR